MPPINILIKPVSSSCNLKCKYCFYNDIADKRSIRNYGIMQYNTLETLVRRTFEYGEKSVGFAFQGGEPTLVGIEFYKRLIELQKKYNTNNLIVYNSIQTNGFEINEEWAVFLSENNFLVGLSLDGPKSIHDLNRVDLKGNGSHNKIEKTINLFNRHGVQYNILCVVTKAICRHIEKIYNYYIKKGIQYLQFIPCLDQLDKEPVINPYSLSSENYEGFLIKLFDLWYRDFIYGKRISIRMFDNIVQRLLGYETESCDMNGRCSANIVVESDGSVYPCDFYVLDQWRIGDINSNTFSSMLRCNKALEFVEESVEITAKCKGCMFYFVCRGGCKRHYEPIGIEKTGSNFLCEAYKRFYEYSLPRFYEIAKRISI